jgi:hypothetical protein
LEKGLEEEEKKTSGNPQGCQMFCFQTKNPNLGKFLEGLAMENL